MAEREQPIERPRPLIASLPQAVRTAIRAKSKLEEINLSRWAESYDATEAEVEATWIHELTKETNSNPAGEGK